MRGGRTCLLLLVAGSLLTFASEPEAEESLCPRSEETEMKEPSCVPFDPSAKSVIVRDTNGRLGNQLFSLNMVLMLRRRFGFQMYITRRTWEFLSTYFPNVDLPVAEDELCEFERVYPIFKKNVKDQRMDNIIKIIEARLGMKVDLKMDDKGRWVIPAELQASTDIPFEQIVHTADFEILSDPEIPASSYPWELFTNRSITEIASEEYLTGKALILYPEVKGYDYDEVQFLQNDTDVYKIMDEALVMRKEFMDAAGKTLDGILKQFEENRQKKKKKSKKKPKKPKRPVVVVGVHSRRTDHLSYQVEKGKVPLKAGYFLMAMDIFREHFGEGKVVFVFISDDIEWGKAALAPRNRAGDLFFASSPNNHADNSSIGHDLALMSLCDHAILSYGTFSYWGGYLTNGSVITPLHFPEYRGTVVGPSIYNKHPLRDPLPRLYYFQH